MSGRLGDLDSSQSAALNTLRENLKDVLKPEHDDHALLRWLRARNFDVKKAEDMMRNNITWRDKNGIDTIRDDYAIPDVLKTYFTGGHSGFDKEGCPVWIDPFGRIDLKGILRSVKKSDIMKTKFYHIETFSNLMKEQSTKLGKNIEQETIIYDLEGLSMRHLWRPGVDLFNEMAKAVEENYPERLKIVFVVNAPKLFPVLWHLIKPFLAAETKKKIKVYGKSNYKEKLLRVIDADQLPAVYGGSMTGNDGDPRCSNKVVQGGEVPKDFYIDSNVVDKTKFTAVTVGKNSCVDIQYNIAVAGSILRWQLLGESELDLLVLNQNKDVIQSWTVPNCPLFPEDGSIECQDTATYIVRLSNKKSSSCNFHYLVDVLEPDLEIGNITDQGSPTK